MGRRDFIAANAHEKIVTIGMMSALAFILQIFDFPVPFAPPFYKLDFSEVPVLICAFAMGPVAGVASELLKNVLKILLEVQQQHLSVIMQTL